MVRAFNQAGVLDVSDVHVAQRLCALAGESDERVALAVAVAVRALRAGSVCVDLLSIARVAGHDDLPWPDPADWLAAVRASPLLADPPVLHLYDDRLLYLDRYWREEEQVCADLLALLTSRRPAGVPDLRRLFPTGFDEQRRAAEIALSDSSIRLARAKRSWAWSTAADNTNPDRLWPVSAAAWRRACSCSGDRRKLRRPVRVSGMYVM